MASVLILVLNLLDGVLTLAIVLGGLAEEANPLMALPLMSWGPAGFMAVKLTLVSLGVALLWRHRERPAAIIGIHSMAAVYIALAVYHVQSVDALAQYIAAASLLS